LGIKLKIANTILIFAFVGFILPVYANVVDPITGLSTCDQMQMEFDRGVKDEWITREILENMDKVENGQIEIIDSDCIFLIDVDAYLTDVENGDIPEDENLKIIDWILDIALVGSVGFLVLWYFMKRRKKNKK
jgi:hypothetical protein